MKFKAVCENHLFQKAYSKGKRAVTSALAVYVLPDYAARRIAKAHPAKKQVNRIGLTATKTLGGAVTRTRCRRLLRESMRLIMKDKTLKTGNLIIIAARRAIVDLKCDEVRRQLEDALARLGIIL